MPEGRLPAAGQTVDWLVLMRRLPAQRMLDRADRRAAASVRADIDALVAVLVALLPPRAGDRRDAADYCGALPARAGRQPRRAAAAAVPAARRGHRARPLRRTRSRAGAGAAAGARRARPASSTATATCGPSMCACCSRRWSSTASNSTPRCARSTRSTRSPSSASSARWPARPGSAPQLLAGCAAALGDAPPAALMHLYTAHRALLRARLAAGPPARRRAAHAAEMAAAGAALRRRARLARPRLRSSAATASARPSRRGIA